MLHLLGATYAPDLVAGCFALISRTAVNEKTQRARELGLPVYNVQWLTDMLIRPKATIERSSSVVYQKFDVVSLPLPLFMQPTSSSCRLAFWSRVHVCVGGPVQDSDALLPRAAQVRTWLAEADQAEQGRDPQAVCLLRLPAAQRSPGRGLSHFTCYIIHIASWYWTILWTIVKLMWTFHQRRI